MPPSPILAVTAYGPRVVPGSRGMARGWTGPGATHRPWLTADVARLGNRHEDGFLLLPWTAGGPH
jgi:hypothetical protein